MTSFSKKNKCFWFIFIQKFPALVILFLLKFKKKSKLLLFFYTIVPSKLYCMKVPDPFDFGKREKEEKKLSLSLTVWILILNYPQTLEWMEGDKKRGKKGESYHLLREAGQITVVVLQHWIRSDFAMFYFYCLTEPLNAISLKISL